MSPICGVTATLTLTDPLEEDKPGIVFLPLPGSSQSYLTLNPGGIHARKEYGSEEVPHFFNDVVPLYCHQIQQDSCDKGYGLKEVPHFLTTSCRDCIASVDPC